MWTHGWRIATLSLGMLALSAGCRAPLTSAAAPATPEGASTSSGMAPAANEADKLEQWYQRKESGLAVPRAATGGEQSLSAAQAAAASGVQPAGADPQVGGTSLGAAAVKPGDDEDSGFDWSSLDPTTIWKKTKAAFGYGPNEPLAQTLLREGLELYDQKKYIAAAAKFQTAADRWPESTLEEDALFYQAESYFFADRYSKSHDTFLVLFKKYPNTRYLDISVTREFAIGRYWEQVHRANPHWPITPNFDDDSRPLFDTAGNALGAYQAVRLNDPTGPQADDAVMATANFYFWQGQYEEALHHYDLIRKDYPKSKHQVAAHVLGLQAARQVYQGPYYDNTPLNNADEIARQALTQFPGKLGEERARIVEAKSEIQEQKAERDYAAGWFYEGKRAYGAARIYYQGIVKDYANTHYADMAKERLAAIKDKPDRPPDYFGWLKVFGTKH